MVSYSLGGSGGIYSTEIVLVFSCYETASGAI